MLNLSPELYEAKIDLENSKGSARFEKSLKFYNQLVEQEAKVYSVSSSEVMRYMDEEYDAYVSSESEWAGSEPEYEEHYNRLCSENTMSTWEGQRYGRYY